MTAIVLERKHVAVRDKDAKKRPVRAKRDGVKETVSKEAPSTPLNPALMEQLGYGDVLSRIAEVGGLAATKEGARIRCQQMALKSQARLRK